MIVRWAPAAAWAYLLFGRGRFWDAGTKLPEAPGGPGGPGEPARWPPVAVVVPARDEAALLPRTMAALLTQDYPGHAHVVLVDDQSSDGTGEVAREVARRSAGASLGLSVVKGAPRPPGWAGKPWAMAQGVQRAMSAPVPPEWILFTDADIAHPPGSLRHLVASAIGSDRAAVSLMARLSTASRWERLTMPLFVYFFAQIYPFKWVNDPERATAAAAGGCLLVKAAALEEAGGVGAFASATIDDVALAKALSAAGFDIWLALAGDGSPGQAPNVESLRHYPHLADVWEMVARNAYTQLGYSPAALAGTVAGLSTVYLAPPLLAAAGLLSRKPGPLLAGLAAWTAMAASYLPIARYYKVPAATAAALPFTSSLYMAMTLHSARRHRSGKTGWKGRPAGPGPSR